MGLKKLFSKNEEIELVTKVEIKSPVSGTVIAMKDVKDEAFSRGILGFGVAIIPTEGVICAPVDGTVTNSSFIKHAVAIKDENGVEIIIHVGLNTVTLNGQHFERMVESGQQVKTGDILVKFDREALLEKGFDLITPVVVSNQGRFSKVCVSDITQVKAQETILILE